MRINIQGPLELLRRFLKAALLHQNTANDTVRLRFALRSVLKATRLFRAVLARSLA